MNLQLLPYVAPLVAAAVVSAVLLVVAIPHRSVPGIRWFMGFMGCLIIWSLGYAAEIVVPGLEGKMMAARFQYLGIAPVGLAWLGFTTEHTGLSWWSPRNIILAFVIPVITLMLAVTNEAHGLVWASVGLSTGASYTVLALGHGPWFWVQVAFSYFCLLAALALLVRTIVLRPPLFRGQAVLLAVGCLPPWVGNLLYVTGVVDTSLDLTVFGFAVAGIMAGWATFRWRLLSIGPIARDTLVEGMADPVVVMDAEGRVVDVNPAAVEVLATSSDRLIGRTASEVLGRFTPKLDPREGTSQQVATPDGARTFDCRSDPLRDGRGRLRGWTLVLHDVTARAAEAAALQRAREVAEDTALAQRAFLTNMNHELRTPLNGVMGMLQVLLDTELTTEQRHFAELAYGSSEELLALVSRVMDFSAMESGRLDLESSDFGLTGVLAQALSPLQNAAQKKGLQLSLEMRPGLPARVVGDPTRLGQVMALLVDNAVKFTDSGSVRVSVSSEPKPDDAILLSVEVRDTGMGIPAHRLKAIFEGFVQADGSTTRRHEGAGLGLTIAQRLVRRMGGELEVTSEVGQGSTFRFQVPLGVAPAG